MSVEAISRPRETTTACLVLDHEDHTDLTDPECTVCGYQAVGFVTFETPGDHERREPFCERHAVDVMASAVLAEPFTPPTVSFLDADAYRPWAVTR